jgi:NADPH:quinone reductase
MRAWQVIRHGEPQDSLTLVDRSSPEPRRRHVVVQVDAAGLNFPDLLLCRGTYHEHPTVPFTPGLEVCGTVVASGEGSRWQVGQRVVAATQPPDGGLAELAEVSDDRVHPVGSGVDAAVAAGMFITYQTAHLALHRRARLRAGETLLVHGAAGGVGSAAVQLGAAAGARVVATAGGAARAAWCRQHGAAEVIDHHREDVTARVKELTEGRGADVAVDPVGGGAFEASRRCIAFEGRIVVIGFAGGTIPEVAAGHVLVKNYAVLGLHWAMYQRIAPEQVRSAHQELQGLLAAGAIDPPHPHLVGLVEVPVALTRLRDREVTGKIVVRVRG